MRAAFLKLRQGMCLSVVRILIRNLARSVSAEPGVRMHVLAQDITAADGQHEKKTVRYSIEDNGNTLIAHEKEETPVGNETISGFSSERRIRKRRLHLLEGTRAGPREIWLGATACL